MTRFVFAALLGLGLTMAASGISWADQPCNGCHTGGSQGACHSCSPGNFNEGFVTATDNCHGDCGRFRGCGNCNLLRRGAGRGACGRGGLSGSVGACGPGSGGLANARDGISARDIARAEALAYPWHCNYYHVEWGTPVALVVPPTAEKQWDLGWGVSNSRLSRIWHQFGRSYPGEMAGGTGQPFLATPTWPSDTSQFGVYYVRGPW